MQLKSPGPWPDYLWCSRDASKVWTPVRWRQCDGQAHDECMSRFQVNDSSAQEMRILSGNRTELEFDTEREPYRPLLDEEKLRGRGLPGGADGWPSLRPAVRPMTQHSIRVDYQGWGRRVSIRMFIFRSLSEIRPGLCFAFDHFGFLSRLMSLFFLVSDCRTWSWSFINEEFCLKLLGDKHLAI
jgi:hypothetical protein